MNELKVILLEGWRTATTPQRIAACIFVPMATLAVVVLPLIIDQL